jgi:cyclase
MREMREVQVVLPDLTFEGRLVLRMGERSVELLHLGPGHTSGDLVVRFPEENAVVTGDLLNTNGWSPRVDRDASGSARNWPRILRQIEEMAPDFVIPGHGEVVQAEGFKEEADRYISYLEELTKGVAEGVREGLPLDVIKETVRMLPFRGMGMFEELLPLNIEAVHREMTRIGVGPVASVRFSSYASPASRRRLSDRRGRTGDPRPAKGWRMRGSAPQKNAFR